MPKKDRYDLREEYHLQDREGTCSEEKPRIFENLTNEKNATREERSSDRLGVVAVLFFDLGNVVSLPKAEVSKFFCKGKFNVYNLTAQFSLTKNVYYTLCTEKMLERFLSDYPNTIELILCSDSSVPYPNLKSITMKFSTPGHSCIQEIDNVHSCIDRMLSKAEYYSPFSLIRLLLK